MSYKQKLVSAVAAGFAVVSFSAFAAAQDNPANKSTETTTQEKREHRGGGSDFGKHGGEERGNHHRGGEREMRGLRQLNLTDAQRQQIRQIMEPNRGKGDSAELQEMRELSRAKHDGTPLTDAQKERLRAFKQQKRQNMEETHRQILAILTDEQRARLEQLEERKRGEMKERRQMRRNRLNSDTPNNDN